MPAPSVHSPAASDTFIIYSSSAGSGKTFTLAKEYLRLALREPTAFRAILALTFTNKATAEMKKRILDNLYELATTGKLEYLDDLKTSFPNETTEQIQERAKESLQILLHQYSFFSVRTIDSFFQQLIRAFARESGLQAGFTLEMDTQKVIDVLIDETLEETGKNDDITHWITQLAQNQIEAGKSWDFRKGLQGMAFEMTKEHFNTFARNFNDKLYQPDFLRQYFRNIRQIIDSYTEIYQDLGQTALDMLANYHIELEYLHRGKMGIGLEYVRAANGTFKEPTSTFRQVVLGDKKWTAGKVAAPVKAAIEQVVEDGLQHLSEELIAHYDKYDTAYSTAKAILNYENKLGLLGILAQKMIAYRERENVVMVSDSTPFLNEIISENDVPYIYEKTGTAYRHFLIDEFQDTSGLQWQNLKPLVLNSQAEGHFSMVVGDIKQSIYRWRNSDLNLLLNQVEKDVPNAVRKNLDTNWRSTPQVINFNNELFKHAPELIKEPLAEHSNTELFTNNEDLQQKLFNQINMVTKAYSDAFQHISTKNAAAEGYVEVAFFADPEKPKGESIPTNGPEPLKAREQMLARLPALFEELQERGVALQDIMLLVRTKREGQKITTYLNEYKSSLRANPA